MGYLDNVKQFAIIAMTMAFFTILFGILSFHSTPLFLIAKILPGFMLMMIGITTYRMKDPRKVDVAFRYIIFVGIGLFISGTLFYYFYYDLYGHPEIAWEYLLIAPMGLILALLGIWIVRTKRMGKWQWRVLILLMVLLTSFSVYELYNTIITGDLLATEHAVRIARDIFQIGNAILLYLVLTAEFKGKTKIHTILDYVGIPSRK